MSICNLKFVRIWSSSDQRRERAMNERVVRNLGTLGWALETLLQDVILRACLSCACTAVAQFSPSVADWSVCLSCAPLWYSAHHWWMTDLCVCHVNIYNIVPTLSGSPTPPIFHPGFDGLKLGPQRNLPSLQFHLTRTWSEPWDKWLTEKAEIQSLFHNPLLCR